jgi:putative metalloenzyme radical SAM/SPASM domain maturase
MRDGRPTPCEDRSAGQRPVPSKLFVEVTTRCNLHCAMCVKEAPGQRIAEGDMTRETYRRLAPAFPHLDAVILNGIGEPLLNPHLEEFVEAARRDVPAAGWVGFQTNGQLLVPRRARALASAGVDRVCISADAVSPDVFRALRRGGQHEAVERAAAALHAAAAQRGRPISVGVEFVAMRDNLDELPALLRWAAGAGVGFVIVTHMLPYSPEMAKAVAFDPATDRAVRLFQAWRDRGAAQGVDVGRYFEVFLKFSPTPAERRVVELVHAMLADASAQGITLHLARLLRHDPALSARAEAAFAEAREIAARARIELRLPASSPTRQRRCEFVESGGAFVSWDGEVHPCYFLWHRYSCHLSGLVKHVRPWSFGRVADRELAALWNDGAARAFREAVLRYDFPFCYDCSHALCDYVEDAASTQDCHLNPVPCAACLWCTGVFQCLQ